MQDGNPTATENSGASTLERLESFLAAREEPVQPKTPETVPEKADEVPVEAKTEEVVETSDDAPTEAEPQLSLSDLAKYLGVDENQLDVADDGHVAIKTKIDGQEGTAKLADFLKTYQLRGHVDNETRAVAEQRKALQAEREQFQQQARQQSEYVASLAQQAQSELMADFNAIDWNQLSSEDPAEYVRQQHQFQQRSQRINQMHTQAQQLAQQHNQQAFVESTHKAAAYLEDKIPGWKPGNEVDTAIMQYAQSIGVADGIGDAIRRNPGLGVLLHQAMQQGKQSDAKAIAEKKVRSAPKLVKPGQSTDANQRAAQEVSALKSAIRKSGGKSGIAEYLMRTGKV